MISKNPEIISTNIFSWGFLGAYLYYILEIIFCQELIYKIFKIFLIILFSLVPGLPG